MNNSAKRFFIGLVIKALDSIPKIQAENEELKTENQRLSKRISELEHFIEHEYLTNYAKTNSVFVGGIHHPIEQQTCEIVIKAMELMSGASKGDL